MCNKYVYLYPDSSRSWIKVSLNLHLEIRDSSLLEKLSTFWFVPYFFEKRNMSHVQDQKIISSPILGRLLVPEMLINSDLQPPRCAEMAGSHIPLYKSSPAQWEASRNNVVEKPLSYGASHPPNVGTFFPCGLWIFQNTHTIGTEPICLLGIDMLRKWARLKTK